MPFWERGFALALIVSAALHGVLWAMLMSFASGSVPRHVQPVGVSCIQAFLVEETVTAAWKTRVFPGRERRDSVRAYPAAAAHRGDVPARVALAEKESRDLTADGPAPVAALSLRKVPEHDTPADKEERNLFAVIRPPAEWLSRGHDEGAAPAQAFPAPMVLPPEGGELSPSQGEGVSSARQGGGEFPGGIGAGNTTARREGGEFSRGNGAGVTTSSLKGGEKTRQTGGGAGPPKDTDAIPRYRGNARPAYPPLARLRGYQGVVVLFVEVLADGRVGQVGVRRSTGHEMLDRAALEAVRSWRFEPGLKEGRAVTMSVEVPFRFILNEYSTR